MQAREGEDEAKTHRSASSAEPPEIFAMLYLGAKFQCQASTLGLVGDLFLSVMLLIQINR